MGWTGKIFDWLKFIESMALQSVHMHTLCHVIRDDFCHETSTPPSFRTCSCHKHHHIQYISRTSSCIHQVDFPTDTRRLVDDEDSK